jgi:molecular chaperone HscB
MDFYALFGLPVRPVVDTSQLAKKYFELQRQSHPDFFSQDSEAEREAALERSASVNKAFTIFKDEYRTLEYFLQLKGVITENEKYELPPDFLMEMLELNDQLETADPAEMIAAVASVENGIKEPILPLLQMESASFNDASLSALKAYYYKKKYLERILDRLGD